MNEDTMNGGVVTENAEISTPPKLQRCKAQPGDLSRSSNEPLHRKNGNEKVSIETIANEVAKSETLPLQQLLRDKRNTKSTGKTVHFSGPKNDITTWKSLRQGSDPSRGSRRKYFSLPIGSSCSVSRVDVSTNDYLGPTLLSFLLVFGVPFSILALLFSWRTRSARNRNQIAGEFKLLS